MNLRFKTAILFVTLPLAYAETTCVTNQSRAPFVEMNSIVSIANNVVADELIKEGIKNFCDKTARARMESVLGNQAYPFKSENEMNSVAAKTPEDITGDAWMLSTFPNSTVRKTGYDNKIKNNDSEIINFKNESEVRDFLGDLKTGVNRYRNKIGEAVTFQHIEHPKDLVRGLQDQSKDFDKMKVYYQAICLTYTPLHTKNCAKMLNDISTMMAPRDGNMALPIIEKVLKTPSYIAGATKAAIKIMDRVKNKNLEGDLMSDIVSSYLECGMKQKDAEEHAWNLLAVYAVRGPNIRYLGKYASEKNLHTIVALDMISSAAPYLDQLRIEKNINPYSYPPGIKTTCTYGKPYHFWMSAFLSRYYGLKYDDPKAAMYAAYISEIGYQMKSQTVGRDPDRVFTVDAFDPANNKMRVDVAFATAGAVYGMKSASEETIASMSVDTAIKKMIEDAKPMPVLSKSKASELWSGIGLDGYWRWKSIIASDSALESME